MPENFNSVIGSRTDTQTQLAYQELERRIVRLQLRPGEVVSEKMLAASLSIGRTPVREALRELAREGLVVILPQRGIIISEIDVAKQLRLLEHQRNLLRFIVGQAVRRASAQQRAALERLATEMSDVDPEKDREATLEFCAKLLTTLIDAARNEFASSAFRLSYGLERRFCYAHFHSRPLLLDLLSNGAAVATAVAEADEDAALQSVNRIVDLKIEEARQSLDKI